LDLLPELPELPGLGRNPFRSLFPCFRQASRRVTGTRNSRARNLYQARELVRQFQAIRAAMVDDLFSDRSPEHQREVLISFDTAPDHLLTKMIDVLAQNATSGLAEQLGIR